MSGFSFLIFSYLIKRKKKKKISIFDTVLLFNDNSRVDKLRVDIDAWKRHDYSSFVCEKRISGNKANVITLFTWNIEKTSIAFFGKLSVTYGFFHSHLLLFALRSNTDHNWFLSGDFIFTSVTHSTLLCSFVAGKRGKSSYHTKST